MSLFLGWKRGQSRICVVAAVLWLACCASFLTPTAASALDGNPEGEIAWAESWVGQSQFQGPDGSWKPSLGWCSRFVANTYGASTAGGDAIDLWHDAQANGTAQTSSWTEAPRGSLIFWDYWEGGTQYGHVAVYVGNGQHVDAGESVVKKHNCSYHANYLGWAPPPGSWPGRSDPDVAPTVSWTSPANAETVRSNTVQLRANASNAARVDFSAYYATDPSNANTAGWHSIGSDTNGADGWGVDWDASQVPDQGNADWGTINLAATAVNGSGQSVAAYRRIGLDRRYAWQFLGQAASRDLVGVSPGECVTVTLTAKNTGTQAWSQEGPNPMHVAASWPSDRLSDFSGSGWVGAGSRAARLPVPAVVSGGQTTFSWPMYIPAQPGEHREHFSLVAEGVTWLNDPGVNYYMAVNGDYSWQFVGQAADRDLDDITPGERFYITLTAKNTGDTIWFKGGPAPIHVAGTSPQDRSSVFADATWISASRATGLPVDRVDPGQTVTFRVRCTAPAAMGVYQEHLSLVAENIKWMNDPDASYHITVKAPATLALTAPSTVAYATATTLSGTLKSATGAALSNRSVSVQYSREASSWATAKALLTNDSGAFSTSVALSRTTRYRIHFAGDAGYASCTSATRTVAPRVYLTTPSAPSSVTRRHAFTVTGKLKPRHARGTRPVKLYCYRYQSGHWMLRKKVSAKVGNYSSYSKYSASVSLPYRGRWRIKAYHAADSLNAKTWSGVRGVRVR